MTKEEIAYLKKTKKPIAKLKPNEQILGGDSKYINPIRKGKAPAEKGSISSFFKGIFK